MYNKIYINNNAKVENLESNNHNYKIIKSKNIRDENVYIIIDQLTGNSVERVGLRVMENYQKVLLKN